MKTNKLFMAAIWVAVLSVSSCKEQKEYPVDADSALKNGSKTKSTAAVTIDENSVIKTANKYSLGFNLGWTERQMRVVMEDGNNLELSRDCISVLRSSGSRLPLSRLAGSDSQWIKWKEAIGPLANRTLQGHPSETKVKQRLGLVEWINLVRGNIDAGAEFVMVLNYETDTPQDYADLAEFLTGDGSVNINGGENWAQKRIELGIPTPVKVAVWELGNEMDHRVTSIYNTPEPYIQKSKEAIIAIKSVCPDAKFAACGATTPWNSGRDWRGWNRAILSGLGSQIDYLTFHPYYAWLQAAWDNMEGYMTKMSQDILATTGSNRIKLYISEHGIWPSSDLNDQTTWTRTHDLRGTLSTGAFIGRLYKRPDVAFSTTHGFSAGPWGSIYRDKIVNQRYTTGIAEMSNAFYNAVGEKVVKATLTDNTMINLETTAMATTNGLNLVIFNLEPDTKRFLTFGFNQGPYLLKKSVVVSAGALDSYNTLGNKLINTTDKIHSGTSAFTMYTVPAKSMVVLYLEKMPGY